MKNENVKNAEKAIENEETALASINEDAALEKADMSLMTLSPELVTLIGEAEAAQTEIRLASIESAKSRDLMLAGTVFDIIDAVETEIRDGDEMKKVAAFNISINGVSKVVLKGLNAFTSRYVLLFNKWRVISIATHQPMPALKNYQFVEDQRYQKVGNFAIVLHEVSANAIGA